MPTRLTHAAALAAAFFCHAAVGGAACERCRYADRGDRFEGVEDWQVSGSSFDLIAVEYRAGKPAAVADRLSVYFWLPSALTPTIEVREPDRNYMMHPAKKPYAAGLQAFSWPTAAVLAPMAIAPGELHAKVSNREETLYFPAYLSPGAPPGPGGTYEFVWKSGAGLDVSCAISRDDGGALVPVAKWDCSSDFGGKVTIRWNGLDAQGQPAPPGRYLLRIKGDMLAETPRPVNATVAFVHYGRLQ